MKTAPEKPTLDRLKENIKAAFEASPDKPLVAIAMDGTTTEYCGKTLLAVLQRPDGENKTGNDNNVFKTGASTKIDAHSSASLEAMPDLAHSRYVTMLPSPVGVDPGCMALFIAPEMRITLGKSILDQVQLPRQTTEDRVTVFLGSNEQLSALMATMYQSLMREFRAAYERFELTNAFRDELIDEDGEQNRPQLDNLETLADMASAATEGANEQYYSAITYLAHILMLKKQSIRAVYDKQIAVYPEFEGVTFRQFTEDVSRVHATVLNQHLTEQWGDHQETR